MVLILFVLSISTIMVGVPQVRAIAVVDVTYGSTPTVDGSISAGEYYDAHLLTFATSGGTCTVYFKHDGSSLYVAFDVPNVDAGSSVQIFVDTNYDRASAPQTDDYRFTIKLDGLMAENQGTGTGWNPTVWDSAVGWTGARQQFASTWNAEFAIPYAKLGITAGVAKTIGISFWNAWAQSDYRWPTGADWVTPSTWGAASSSDNWAPPPPMYWKQNFTDYAPSGMPDFDQKQDAWYPPDSPGYWTWCGPTAVANSLWWMDSRFETSTTPPPTINDTFPLVTNYTAGIDDHDPLNVPPFIEHLAYLMDTDGNRTGLPHTGTNVWDMEAGIAQYLSWTGVNPLGDVNGDGIVNVTDWNIVNASMGSSPGAGNWNLAADIWPETVTGPYTADNVVNASDLNLVTANMGSVGMFYEHTVERPDFYYIEEEVERCQDVVLLLGYWRYGEMKDQYQEICEVCEHVGPVYWISWQEFVPTANSLSRVEVKIARTLGQPNLVPITMTIESPLGTVLTSATLQYWDVPELPWCETVWVSFDVPDIPLTPGQSYYIVLTTEGLAYHWCAAPWDAYPPGLSNFGPDWDWTFRTFYYGWERDHGHYVTVAGVNSELQQIAFSDPYIDAFEAGVAPGRSPVPHPYPHVSTVHNNASLVSHDIYNVTYEPCPGGDWTIIGYPDWPYPEWLVQIEFAIITSPHVCGVNITNVTASHRGILVDAAYQTWTVNVNVTVHNNGTVPINCTVTAYYFNATATYQIGTQNATNLAPCNITTLTFNWDLSGVPDNATYTIKANATCTCDAHDELINGQVKIRPLGDITGEGKRTVSDMLVLKVALTKIMLGLENPIILLAQNPFLDITGDGDITVSDMLVLKVILTKIMLGIIPGP